MPLTDEQLKAVSDTSIARTKEALEIFLARDPIEFEEVEIRMLAWAGYTTPDSLTSAREASLEKLGLRPGPMDAILAKQNPKASAAGVSGSEAGALGAAAVMFENTMTRVVGTLEQLTLGVQELTKSKPLSAALSEASQKFLNDVAVRLGLPILRGRLFPPCGNHRSLPPFQWPRIPTGPRQGREDEVAGYPDAAVFLNTHVCPAGVKAIVKNEDKWLDCNLSGEQVHLRSGASDVLFVIEEAAQEVQDAENTASVVAFLLGQAELKTVKAFKEAPERAVAQGTLQHIAARVLQEGTLQNFKSSKQFKFVTMMSDLNSQWRVVEEGKEGLLVYERTAGNQQLGYCAAQRVRKLLEEAADSLRAALRLQGYYEPDEDDPPLGPQLTSERPPGLVSSSAGSSNTGGSGGGSAAAPHRSGSVSSRPGTSNQRCFADMSSNHSSQPAMDGRSIRIKARIFRPNLVAMVRQDDDIMRGMDAAFSSALISFFKQPLGYKGLIGRMSPPRSIQHTPLSDVFIDHTEWPDVLDGADACEDTADLSGGEESKGASTSPAASLVFDKLGCPHAL